MSNRQKKLDANSNKYLSDYLDGKTDDLKYCPHMDQLDYKEYNNKSYLGTINKELHNPELDGDGCKNNISFDEAKQWCNLYDDCDGFYIRNKYLESRACFKYDQYIEDPQHADDSSNASSAFYLKKSMIYMVISLV